MVFLASRAFVWLAGLAGIAAFGYSDEFDVERGINPYDGAARALFAPVAAWDAGQYLGIAMGGYESHDTARFSFFPLYPLLIHAVGGVIGSLHVAGLLISCAAFLAAMYLLYRLTDIELGAASARRATVALAFSPMAFFFSALYTESLFLALTIGAVYSARVGKWPAAGMLGALATATRSTGILLLVPLLLLLLYGPREDHPDRRPSSTPGSRRPSYTLGREALWLLLVPLGLVAYLGYSAAVTGDPLRPLGAQAEFGRHLSGPVVAIWQAFADAGRSARDIWRGESLLGYYGEDAFVRNSPFELAALVAAAVAAVGAVRRLPIAYGAYAVVSLIYVISAPNEGDALLSFPRFALVIFPLFMWLGHWAHTTGRIVTLACVGASLLAACTSLFATWHFIA